jgi:hypothetical protein
MDSSEPDKWRAGLMEKTAGGQRLKDAGQGVKQEEDAHLALAHSETNTIKTL